MPVHARLPLGFLFFQNKSIILFLDDFIIFVEFLLILFIFWIIIFYFWWFDSVETYPSEATRVELSEKLGLSDRQLQMWFCHRRLKDKKEVPAKRPRKTAAPMALPESPVDELRAGGEPGSDYGSGSGSSPFGRLEFRNAMTRSVVDDVPMGRRYYESRQSMLELRAIACVEAQLGEPLRDDGPILGIEFDPLPPDAFGAPIGTATVSFHCI